MKSGYEYININLETLKVGDSYFIKIKDIKDVFISTNISETDFLNHSFSIQNIYDYDNEFEKVGGKFPYLYEEESVKKEKIDKYNKFIDSLVTMVKYVGNGKFIEYFSQTEVLFEPNFKERYSNFENFLLFNKSYEKFKNAPLIFENFLKPNDEIKHVFEEEVSDLSGELESSLKFQFENARDKYNKSAECALSFDNIEAVGENEFRNYK